jgi:hypothetical protein
LLRFEARSLSSDELRGAGVTTEIIPKAGTHLLKSFVPNNMLPKPRRPIYEGSRLGMSI